MLLTSQTFLQPKDSFKVYARIRPFTQKQQKLQPTRQFFSHDLTSISVKTKNFQQNFNFDHIFNSQSEQSQIFDLVSRDILDNAFRGINGSIFCYGQTCSGKTHTIVGDYGANSLENEGLLPRILKEVISRKDQKIDDAKSSKLDIRIKVSMIQIYNQKIFDLLDLSRKDLRLRQNKKQGVFVENLTEQYISSVDQGMKFVFSGLENRTSGKTNQNTVSSRSHMIFAISIVETDFEKKEAKSSKITLIDLAGSQRLAKTGVEGKMLLQTKKINLSLSTLGKVINALGEGSKKHIPYRDSKLTRLLKQSIGGNCLTRLIINLSPSNLNQSETVSALRFGSTAKLIKNRPRINKEYTVEELLVLLEKAELKIKQLTKFIEEFDKNRSNQSGFPKQLFDLRNKATQAISFHLIDCNDEESDERMSFQGSKVSSVNQSSQYLSNDGSGVFSPFGMDVDVDSPEVKKKYKKPAIASCKSMKLLPFGESPDFKILNQSNEYQQDITNNLKVSQFIQNEEEGGDSHQNLSRGSRMMETFNVGDLSDILGQGVSLRKNCSVKIDEKLDFSVKSIHESVNQIRQRCLKRMGTLRDDSIQVLSNRKQTQKNTKQIQFDIVTSKVLSKTLSIIPCFSMNLGTQISLERQSKGKRAFQQRKLDKATCELLYQTECTLQKTEEPSSMLKQQTSLSLEGKEQFEHQGISLKLIQGKQKSQTLNSKDYVYKDNYEDVQKYKKIIKDQNYLIGQMRKKQALRRNSLSQDIDKLKLVIAQKSPRSSIMTLQTIQKYQI